MNLVMQQIRRLIIAVIGLTVLLIGLAMIVLPGPAFLVIPLGLSILALEFAWAKRLLGRVKRATAGRSGDRTTDVDREKPAATPEDGRRAS